MSSLFYLIFATSKNQFKEIVKSPAKLILYVAVIGFVIFTFVPSLFIEMPDDPTNPLYLKGIFFAFFMLSLVTSIVAAIKGASPYNMEDVNLLFPSPIKAKSILLFGIIKAIKPILLGSWFVFFQANWFRSSFGVGLGGFFFVWLGYVLFSFITQLLQIFIYAFTHESMAKKRIAATVTLLCFAPLVFGGTFHLVSSDFAPIYALTATLESRVLDFTPFIGWAAYGTANLALGNAASAALFTGLVFVFGATLFVILYVKDPDFYEHAAGVTQSAYEIQRDAMEGDVQSVLNTRENVKVKGTGLFGFSGASAFFGKHLRESLRAGRLGLWGLPSLAFVVGSGFLAHVSFNANASSHGWNLLLIVSGLIGIKYFTSGLGRGYLETFSHYIYLIPENPMRKWFWANGEYVAKVAGEAAAIFVVVGFITREHPLALFVSIVLYVSFTFYMLAINLAFMRFTGIFYRSTIMQVISMFLYIIPVLPGVTVSVVVALFAPEAWILVVGGTVLTWWLLVCGFLLFMASKGILHNCDMPSYMISSLEQSKL